MSCLKTISNKITWALETTFYRIGLFVGTYPWLTIVFSVSLCLSCGIGLKTFSETDAQEKLWVPQDSRVQAELQWVNSEFPTKTRFVSLVLTYPDVLMPSVLQAMFALYKDINSLTGSGKTYSQLCFKLNNKCRVTGLLELWNYEESSITSLTRTQVLTTVNTTTKSPVFGTDLDVTTYLGGTIRRDSDGLIIGAEVTQMLWLLKPSTAAKNWEGKVIERALQGQTGLDKVYVYASRSFQDEGYGAINSDIILLSAGFSIVFVFVMVSLGKFNMVEQRIIVSLLGLGSVGLAILFAYGVATFLDIIYGPIQSIMPFLLLGIGVDDMFVIVEAWRNLTPDETSLPLPDRIGLTLKHAGVSVTVTSITDVVAFGIGASTVIPALSAFCIYAALGILALYVLQSTFFVACLVIDERRRSAKRNACICCYKHRDYQPNRCSQRAFLPAFFEKYFGPFLMKLPVKVVMMCVVAVLVNVNLWRFILLKQDFDLTNYIPSDSYAYDYARSKEKYFANEGTDTAVYCGDIGYYNHSRRLDDIHRLIESNPYIQKGTVISWFKSFQQYSQAVGVPTSDADFNSKVFQFIKTSGQNLKTFIKFNSTKEPVRITASYFTMKHTLQPDSAGEIVAMDSLRSIVDNGMFPLNLSPDLPTYQCFPFSRNYLTYETNRVLLGELYRNLGLAAACVLVVTLILIANLWTSLLVFTCVLFTVICVAGTLELWGVTIDTASSVLLILSVGLAVDYSAHVGHTFMTVHGTRSERSIQTLKKIGPAVFNGGFSTFLAFVLLSTSASYGFTLFFRVFFSVVIFGLFFGLCYLPIILSWIGPAPYDLATPPKYSNQSTSKIQLNGHSQNIDDPLFSSLIPSPVNERRSQVSPVDDEDGRRKDDDAGMKKDDEENVHIPPPDYD